MATHFVVHCSSCGVEYALPEKFRHHFEGRAVQCAACQRWWVPVRASSGPPVKLVEGRPERAKVDMSKFQRRSAAETAGAGPALPPAVAAPLPAETSAASNDVSRTMRVAVPTPQSASLRLVLTGPGTDLKGVFDLDSKSFLIGQSGCHLNLPRAPLPAQAIRIRAEQDGFLFAGIDGFPIPIGGMSVLSGQIRPGGVVLFELLPYRLQLETSATPGSPIADLDKTVPPPPPTPAPPAPVASPPPASPALPSLPGPAPRYTTDTGPAVDLRQQVQELAADIRSGDPDFADQVEEVEADLDQTVTDLGARGFQSSRFGGPLEGLELALVRADGPTQGKRFAITKTPLLIGRTGGDMVIADRRVSSKHAQLDIAGPRVYTLKDLASTNGTMVNDRPVSVGHLQDGDV
ncbi:MAG: FHA domain-containing protein, partial [Thermoanaerobaculia bacterium]